MTARENKLQSKCSSEFVPLLARRSAPSKSSKYNKTYPLRKTQNKTLYISDNVNTIQSKFDLAFRQSTPQIEIFRAL